MPASYQIPLWRWILLPATALMLKRNGGVWINGSLVLTATDLRFVQSKVIKTAPPETWSVPIEHISRVVMSKGFASETIEVHHSGGIAKFMTARAGGFLDQLRSVVPVQ